MWFHPYFLIVKLTADNLVLEFASSDTTQGITWGHGSTSGVDYHTFQLSTQQEFVETSDQADWGQWFISTADEDKVRRFQGTICLACGSKRLT